MTGARARAHGADLPPRTPEEAATPNLIVTCHAAFCSPEGMVEMRTTSARIARAAVLVLGAMHFFNMNAIAKFGRKVGAWFREEQWAASARPAAPEA